MKELDFLPDWYRADRQRKVRRHRYCVLFGLVAALLAIWSFVVGRSVSSLKAEARQIEAALEESRQSIQAALEMEQDIAALGRKTTILETLTPRTTISAVLAELAYSVNEQIIFSRVLLAQEPVTDARSSAASATRGIVRLGAAKSPEASAMPDGPQRTRMTLTGIAAGGADVARLIDRLETSVYFEQITPGFSRARKIGSGDVTEFEITCTIADYQVIQ